MLRDVTLHTVAPVQVKCKSFFNGGPEGEGGRLRAGRGQSELVHSHALRVRRLLGVDQHGIRAYGEVDTLGDREAGARDAEG